MDCTITDKAFVKLSELRLEQKLCDVNLVVGRRQYHAHKVVLAARSSYFYTMLRAQKKETVELLESCFEPEGLMEKLLEYMYTGRVENVDNIEVVQQMIAAADVLNLEGLQSIMAHNLLNAMSLENYPELMKWIEGYSLDNLLIIPSCKQSEHWQSSCSDLELSQASDTKYFLAILNKLRLRGDFVDVQLMVDGKEFPAHKVILSAFNGYFAAMFTNETREKSAKFVEMKLVTSSAIESALELFYTAKLKSLAYDEAQDVIMVADYLDIDILKSKAAEELHKQISCGNVFHLLELSVTHHCKTLTCNVVAFLIESFESLLEAKEFLGISNEILDRVISSEELDVEEETIFEFAMCWMQHSSSERTKYLLNVLKQIKFEQLPLCYLERKVLHSRLIRCSNEGNEYVSSFVRRKKSGEFGCIRARGYTEAKILIGVDEDQINEEGKPVCSYLCYIPKSKRWCDISSNIGYRILPGPVVACHLGIFMMAFEPYKVDCFTMALYQLHMSQPFLHWTKVIPLNPVISGGPLAHFDVYQTNYGALNLSVLGDILYTVGSTLRELGSCPSALYCYNPVKSNGWEICASLNTKRRCCALTSCQGSLYIIGGEGSNYQWLSTVEQYSPGSKHCTVVPSMLEARGRPVCTSSKSRIFVIGGMVDNGEMGLSSEMYDCITNEWNFFPACETPRRTAGVTLFEGKIYLFGGLDEDYDIVYTNEIYDISLNSWSRDKSIPRAATQSFCCWAFIPMKTVKTLPVVIDEEECSEDVQMF